MKVSVVSARRKYRPLEKRVLRALSGALRIFTKKDSELEVYLVGNGEMKKINRISRRKNKVANVLAFETPASFPHPQSRKRFLGEIYLAPDYILKKEEDISYLALHGLLHLLGYDHIKNRDRIKMEKKERALWRALF